MAAGVRHSLSGQMMAKTGAGHRGQSSYLAPVRIEDWPDEWQEWVALTPMERFRESEKIFAQYIIAW